MKRWSRPIVKEELCRLAWLSRSTGKREFGGWSDAPRRLFEKIVAANNNAAGGHLHYDLESQWVEPRGHHETVQRVDHVRCIAT